MISPEAGGPRDPSHKKKRDLICFSHLRWNLVFQRPQHLMTRFAREHRVFFLEEPLCGNEPAGPWLQLEPTPTGVTLAIPRIPRGLSEESTIAAQWDLLVQLFREKAIRRPILWYYTPMALAFSEGLPATAIVYDCMDELSAFVGAPPAILERERQLFRRADVVFTGGRSLYEAKRTHHRSVYLFPSSVDVAHFRRARAPQPEPADQATIPRPRIGHYAVLDERLDTDLLAAVADVRPDWHLVMLGPIVKITTENLPQRPNIHYLGPKSYAELPAYLAGWDATFMPFALNEATRFISPTKTPEYLAAGRPVVSTPIRDVVRAWGERGLVQIAANRDEVVAALEAALADSEARSAWLAEVDRALAAMSWDKTFARMRDLISWPDAAASTT
jgi:glycosyltransferase involved in cell wall biosynthesis